MEKSWLGLVKDIFDKKNWIVLIFVLIAFAIVTGLITFLPKSILAEMRLDDWLEYKKDIGAGFWLSVSLILVIVGYSIIKCVWSKIRNQMAKKEQRKKFQKLSEFHKSIIFLALSSREKSVPLNTSSGDTIYLQNNNFLYNPPQVPIVRPNNEIFERFAPREWLIDLYNEEPELFRIKIRR
jgi:hypothetical protein